VIIYGVPDGNYAVTVSNAGGCSGFDIIHATFKPSPSANLADDTAGCGSVVLDAGNPGATYLWSTGAITRTINVTSSGVYSVRVTGAGADACFRDDTSSVTIQTAPVVDLGVPSMDICESNPVVLDAGNPGSTYLWSTGATSQTITVSLEAIYSVVVTNAAGCSASDSVIVINKPAPISDFNVTGTDLQANFTVPSQTGVAYSWSFGDNTSSSQPNPSHVYTTAGTYMVILTVTNVATGCKSFDTLMVTVPFTTTGIGTSKDNYELTAYPNPFSNKTQIEFELNQLSDVTLEIYDVMGRKVSTLLSNAKVSGKQKHEWNVNDNSTGLFYVRLTVDGRTSILRLNSVK
jgi:PKD repeat protein